MKKKDDGKMRFVATGVDTGRGKPNARHTAAVKALNKKVNGGKK